MSRRKFSEIYKNIVGPQNTADICTPSKKDRLTMLELYCELACMLYLPLRKWGVHAQKINHPSCYRSLYQMEALSSGFRTENSIYTL